MLTHLATYALDPVALQDYQRVLRARWLSATRWVCLAGTLSLAAFSVADSTWKAIDMQSLLVVRSATLAALWLILLTSFTARGVGWIKPLGTLACLFLLAGMVMSAEFAGGGLSIYRDPIYMTFMGLTLLFPWSPWAAAGCFACGIGFYNILYFFTGGMGSIGSWAVSNVLLCMGAGVSTVSVHTLARLRRLEFGYRRRLRQLEATLIGPPIGSAQQLVPVGVSLLAWRLEDALPGGTMHVVLSRRDDGVHLDVRTQGVFLSDRDLPHAGVQAHLQAPATLWVDVLAAQARIGRIQGADLSQNDGGQQRWCGWLPNSTADG